MRYLICYDFSNNKRRRKMAKFLEGYLLRIQGSVFLGELDKKHLLEIRNEIFNLAADKDEDETVSVYICPMCDNCWTKHWELGGINYGAIEDLVIV